MKNRKIHRFAVFILCFVFVCAFSSPALAADNLDHQYAFVHAFNFADFYRIAGVPWYGVQFGDDLEYLPTSGDSVIFTVDDYRFETSFCAKYASGLEFHYIGNCSSFTQSGEDTGEPFCLVICPENSAYNQLLLRQDYFETIYQDDDTQIHLAISVPFTDNGSAIVPTFMSEVISVFASAIGMVSSVAKTVSSTPILYLPIVIGLCGIGIAFFRRVKQ